MESGLLSISTRQIVRGADDPRVLELEVADTGPGVQDDQKALIFQPFFSRRVRGMGLGLSIVKHIIEAHGGRIVVQSEVAKGSRFTIELPLSTEKNAGD